MTSDSVSFVCLFVGLWRKNYGTERHQTLRDYKVGLQKCPPRVEIDRLAVPGEISFNFWFFHTRLTATLLFRSIDFWLTGGLIYCRPTMEFKLGRRYSSYPPLLTAQILRNSLGPTRCRATRRSRSPPKACALLVTYIQTTTAIPT